MKILTVIGTRPEAIKLAPVHTALLSTPGLSPKLLLTGQHRELARQALKHFSISPDFDLDVMEPSQTLVSLAGRLTSALADAMNTEKPDAIIVQGDTTSAMIAGQLGFFARIPVAHVEAGLRTGNLLAPYPEEFNRRVLSLAATWHFAPTATAAACLSREGIGGGVHVVGNTVIDAALDIAARSSSHAVASLPWLSDKAAKVVLVTLHRRENFGQPMADVADAIAKLACDYGDLNFVLPVHPNPAVSAVVRTRMAAIANVYLVEPLDYPDLIAVMKRSFVILTDSGGIQEEAPAFNVPVLVLRNESERMEGIEAGCAELVGTNGPKIVEAFVRLCNDDVHHKRMAEAKNPYGDGRASLRIAQILKADLIKNTSQT